MRSLLLLHFIVFRVVRATCYILRVFTLGKLVSSFIQVCLHCLLLLTVFFIACYYHLSFEENIYISFATLLWLAPKQTEHHTIILQRNIYYTAACILSTMNIARNISLFKITSILPHIRNFVYLLFSLRFAHVSGVVNYCILYGNKANKLFWYSSF